MIKQNLSKLLVLSSSIFCLVIALQISSCVSIQRKSLPELTEEDILKPNDIIEYGVYTNGEYDENLGVNRAIIYIPNFDVLMVNVRGQIVVNFCVDPKGNVVYSKLLNEETTIKDKRIIRRAVNLSMKYKYVEKPELKVDQCGKFIFKIDVGG